MTESNSLLNDGMWYYFNITQDNIDKIEQLQKVTKKSVINLFRKKYFQYFMAPSVEQKSQNHRDVLKEFYDQNKPVSWIATAGDISLPQGRQSGNLLLYHLAIEKVNEDSSLIPILYVPGLNDFQVIDNHAWLRVSDIKYFGEKDEFNVAYGDVLFGTSLVKKYQEKDGRDSYTLGSTIIRKNGVIIGDNYDTDCSIKDPKWMAMTNAKVQDYDHAGREMLQLSYTKKAKQKIKQVQEINIQNLSKKKYFLTTKYKKKNTYNFHDLMQSDYITMVREELKKSSENNEEFHSEVPDGFKMTLDVKRTAKG